MRISAVTGAGPGRAAPARSASSCARPGPRRPTPTPRFVIHRPVPEGVTVERVGDGEYRVHGRAALRAVALSDITNTDALAYADDRLKKLGVDKALARAGAAQRRRRVGRRLQLRLRGRR